MENLTQNSTLILGWIIIFAISFIVWFVKRYSAKRKAAKQSAEQEAAKRATAKRAAERAAAKVEAEQEAAKRAAEQEAAKRARSQAAAKRAQNKEAAKRAAEQEAARVAAEQEAAMKVEAAMDRIADIVASMKGEVQGSAKREQAKNEVTLPRLSPVVLRTDGHVIIDFLKQKGIKVLYHFTDEENWQSIQNYGGLYSWKFCDLNNIAIAVPGGDTLSRDLDRNKKLENYV